MSKIIITALVTTAVIGGILYFYLKKEGYDMALVYVSLIIKGRRTFSSVPAPIKEQVRQILIDLELEYLIDEDGEE